MSSGRNYEDSTKGIWAYGIAAFGGVLLVTVGLFQLIEGLSAIVEDDVFLVTSDYLYSFDLTTWGWIHLAVGAVAVVVGLCVLYGQTWARATGILIATVSVVANFAWLPHFPVWSLLVIAVDVLVIWALSSLIVNS